ncbi:MAG: hypothetical protein JJ896_02910 [Rhodothermales bacterium]|nr:hypothetical protein [Rhodothermales bacterium]MBO6778582.1 hypothetical protein [Rhodothermales bacterium]
MRTLYLVLVASLVLGACASGEGEVAEAETPVETVVSDRPNHENPAGNPEGEVPPGWEWRFDRGPNYSVGSEADSVDTFFVTMTPGWHITTAPAGIFFHPASTADGSYTASTQIHLFPPGNRNEGYGILVGGSDLSGEAQEYLYFLLRRSGEYLVKLRKGAETETLIPWTAHESIVAYTEDTEGTATNVMAVQVDGETLRFHVNDVEVATLPKAELPTDGLVGLRFNHAIDVHVSELTVTPAA